MDPPVSLLSRYDYIRQIERPSPLRLFASGVHDESVFAGLFWGLWVCLVAERLTLTLL